MKPLRITHYRAAFGFAPESEPRILEAVEFTSGRAKGKVAVAESSGMVAIYDSRRDVERALARSGDVFIEDDACEERFFF